MIDHEMYRRKGTMQRYSEEIYIDVARAFLSGLNDSIGGNKRSRILSTNCGGDVNLLEAELLQKVVPRIVARLPLGKTNNIEEEKASK